MKKRQTDKLSQFYYSYDQTLKDLEKSHTFPKTFYSALMAGKNTLYQKSMSETKTFDETWIKTIESYFPSIEKIILNPKSGLKYLEEIVPIEKAKKIRSNSIRHLASHTHFIREIRDEVVMPKKIMTTETDIDYGTYENRFVMTLIERLFNFVRSRHELIKDNIISYQKKHFNYTSTFHISDLEVDLNLDVVFKEDLEDKSINIYNKGILERVEYLSKRVTSIRNSPFMNLMSGEKKVLPPIMQTNVILKNVDFRNCYVLWLFLDRYNTLAYDVTVKEKDMTFDRSYQDAVERLALNTFTMVAFNQGVRKPSYDEIVEKEIIKKAFKIANIHVNDIVDTPEPIVVEDERINQYFLQENIKIFKKRVEEEVERSSTYEVGLKRALRDTISISNAIFKHHFELEENDDYFARMVKDDDVEKNLEVSKEKAKIARIIRETKEVDYNNAIRLERKLMKDIEAANQRLILMNRKKTDDEAERIKIEAALKEQKDIAAKEAQMLSDNLELVNQNREALTAEKKQVDENITSETQKAIEENNALINNLKQTLQNQLDQKIATLDRHFQAEREAIEKEQAKQIKKLEREEKLAITEAQKKAKAEYRLVVQNLRKKAKIEHDRMMKKLKLQRQKEQEKLLKEFEKLKLTMSKRQEKALLDIQKQSEKDIEKLKKDGLPKETKTPNGENESE
jgi:hypothetical protein